MAGRVGKRAIDLVAEGHVDTLTRVEYTKIDGVIYTRTVHLAFGSWVRDDNQVHGLEVMGNGEGICWDVPNRPAISPPTAASPSVPGGLPKV